MPDPDAVSTYWTPDAGSACMEMGLNTAKTATMCHVYQTDRWRFEMTGTSVLLIHMQTQTFYENSSETQVDRFINILANLQKCSHLKVMTVDLFDCTYMHFFVGGNSIW